MTQDERMKRLSQSATEVLREEADAHRWRVAASGESPTKPEWFVHILCDGRLFTVSGKYGPEPDDWQRIKEAIRTGVRKHLS